MCWNDLAAVFNRAFDRVFDGLGAKTTAISIWKFLDFHFEIIEVGVWWKSIIIGVLVYAFLYEKKHLSKIYGYGILALSIITILLLFLPQQLTQRFFDVSQGAVLITEQGITKDILKKKEVKFEFN